MHANFAARFMKLNALAEFRMLSCDQVAAECSLRCAACCIWTTPKKFTETRSRAPLGDRRTCNGFRRAYKSSVSRFPRTSIDRGKKTSRVFFDLIFFLERLMRDQNDLEHDVQRRHENSFFFCLKYSRFFVSLDDKRITRICFSLSLRSTKCFTYAIY